MRIGFDKNVPVGVRRFLARHDVNTFFEMGWHPQLENGDLLDAAETGGFDVMVYVGPKHQVSAEPDRPEARLGHAQV